MAVLGRTWRSCARLLVALALLGFLTNAQAQDYATDAGNVQQLALARALFDEGVALGDAGDWVGAADRFGRAYALRPTSNVAYNWASALLETQHLLEAQELLLSIQRDETASAELKRACGEQLTALATRIPRVRIDVDAEREVSLEVDGRNWPRAAWGVASPIDPGTHVARLHEQGSTRAREEFSLHDGETRQLALSTRTSASAASQADIPRSKAWRSWALWGALGVVLVAGAVTATVLATRHDARAEEPLTGNAAPGVLRW